MRTTGFTGNCVIQESHYYYYCMSLVRRVGNLLRDGETLIVYKFCIQYIQLFRFGK